MLTKKKIPVSAWMALTVILLICSIIGWAEYRRRIALDVLYAIGSELREWKDGSSHIELSEAKKLWLEYPKIIVTGTSPESVTHEQIGAAISTLNPTSLIIQIEGRPSPKLMKELGKCHHLQSLNFDRSPDITDDDLQYLKGLPHLEELLVDGSQITSASFEVLHSMPKLRAVSLSDKITAVEKQKLMNDKPGLKAW